VLWAPAILHGLAAVGLAGLGIELFCLWRLRHTVLSAPAQWPEISLLKPLCGEDDELEENLESHVGLDYPGTYEVLLGVSTAADSAHGVAVKVAARHPDRVRVVLQEGSPGLNPKVNQLLTLTRAAHHDTLVVTDSSVRVAPSYLREMASVLAIPGVGIAASLFSGVGERRLGAVLNNMSLACCVTPSLAAAVVALRSDQVVGKSLGVTRGVLRRLGGWEAVQDVLAEDQRLGAKLKEHGLRSGLTPTLVQDVQRDASLGAFWARHCRWAMIRFRVLIPGVALEPLLNPFVLAGCAWCLAPSIASGLFAATMAVAMIAVTQWGGLLSRGHGFRWRHLVLQPVRDVVFFACWLRGATLRTVLWRGRRLRVGARTLLGPNFVDCVSLGDTKSTKNQ
jgi:ceramide glucosyltransferase